MRPLDERWGQSPPGRAAQDQPSNRLQALRIRALEAELAASSGALLRALAALDAHRAEAEASLDEAKRATMAAEAQRREREGMLIGTSARLKETQGRLVAAEGQLAAVAARLGESDHRIAVLQASTSWRITAPLRSLAVGLRSLPAAILGGCRLVAGWTRPRR